MERVPSDWSTDFRGRRNPYCAKCGDERGGTYGHETSECSFRSNPAKARRNSEEAARQLEQDPVLRALLNRR